MGLPFDWHLRPRRITQLRSSAAQRAEQAGALLGMGRLSSLRQSVAGIRNTLRRFSMHPVGIQSPRPHCPPRWRCMAATLHHPVYQRMPLLYSKLLWQPSAAVGP